MESADFHPGKKKTLRKKRRQALMCSSFYNMQVTNGPVTRKEAHLILTKVIRIKVLNWIEDASVGSYFRIES